MTEEKKSPEEVRAKFKEDYENLVEQSKKLRSQLEENKANMNKFEGAMETLNYFYPPETKVEDVESEDVESENK